MVGAGPTGLWTAIQIKKRRPDLDVQLYERHQEYQRSHVLKLENASLLYYSKTNRDGPEAAFYKEVTGKRVEGIMDEFQIVANSTFIRTHDLEKALKNYAEALGIKVSYETIEDPAALMAKHPECKRFIAADGAHSKMRRALLGEDAVDDLPLQHVVEIKYEAEGRAGRLGDLKGGYRTNKLLSHMAFEYVGKEKNGKTPVTLRFFLDKKTYDVLPQASFKDPLTLGDKRLPETLAKDIRTYMNVRKAKAGETYAEGSAKISKLTLSMYAAKKFALVTDGGQGWFFVGDAAMGVPYFRALNSGMIVGSQLALILTRDLLSTKAKVASYNGIRPLDIQYEFNLARGKDLGLNIYDAFRRMRADAPLQTNKWDDQEAEAFQETTRKAAGKKPGPRP